MKKNYKILILAIVIIALVSVCFTGCTEAQIQSLKDTLEEHTIIVGGTIKFTPKDMIATDENPIIFEVTSNLNSCENSDRQIASIDEDGIIMSYGAGVFAVKATQGDKTEDYAVIIAPRNYKRIVAINDVITKPTSASIVDYETNLLIDNGDGTYTAKEVGTFVIRKNEDGLYTEQYDYTIEE
ncbi:MAG: hypothetical protein WCR54_01025 [Clostridia bacterium]